MNSMLFQCKVNALKEQLQHFYKMKRKRLLDNIKNNPQKTKLSFVDCTSKDVAMKQLSH